MQQFFSPSRYEVFAHLDAPVSSPPRGLLCHSQPWAGGEAQAVCTALPFLVPAGCVGEQVSKASECFGCGRCLQCWHVSLSAPTCTLSPRLLRNNLFLAGQLHAADQNWRPACLLLAVPALVLWPQAKPLLPSLPAVPLPVSHH